MNFKLRVIGSVSMLLAAGAIALASAAGSASSATAPNATIISEYDQDQLGLHLATIPVGAPEAAIASDGAALTAADALGTKDVPAQILHVVTSPDASKAARSVYVVLFLGGDPIPGGPKGDLHPVSYRGVVVDDQTGEVLRMFATGKQ